MYAVAKIPLVKFPLWGKKWILDILPRESKLWLISSRCWWLKGLYHDKLLFLQLKWLVEDSPTPAPVLPVVAFTCISEISLLFSAKGKRANWIAVAKHPGFAIELLFSIDSLWSYGNP